MLRPRFVWCRRRCPVPACRSHQGPGRVRFSFGANFPWGFFPDSQSEPGIPQKTARQGQRQPILDPTEASR